MTQILLNIILGCLVLNAFYRMWVHWRQITRPEPIIEVKKYFYLQQAVLCAYCDCVFSYKDFNKCPSCGNSNNFFINLSLQSLNQKGAMIQ